MKKTLISNKKNKALTVAGALTLSGVALSSLVVPAHAEDTSVPTEQVTGLSAAAGDLIKEVKADINFQKSFSNQNVTFDKAYFEGRFDKTGVTKIELIEASDKTGKFTVEGTSLKYTSNYNDFTGPVVQESAKLKLTYTDYYL